MLLILRILTILLGAGLGYYVYLGTMPGEIFRLPGFIAAGALAFAALMPRGISPSAMLTAHGLSLGICLVALMAYVGPSKAVDLRLIAAMAVNLTTILLLHPRSGAIH